MRTRIFILLIAFAILTGCSFYNTMVNVSRLKFKLGAVNNFSVGDISLSDKNTLKDFNPLDIIKLTAVATKGELPVSFTLNV